MVIMWSASPLEVLDEQFFAREKPSDATATEGHGRLRAESHDQAPRGSAPHHFIQVVYLIAEVMQTAAALQKSFDGGVGTCRFDQFDAGITGVAWVDERHAHALQGIVPSF